MRGDQKQTFFRNRWNVNGSDQQVLTLLCASVSRSSGFMTAKAISRSWTFLTSSLRFLTEEKNCRRTGSFPNSFATLTDVPAGTPQLKPPSGRPAHPRNRRQPACTQVGRPLRDDAPAGVQGVLRADVVLLCFSGNGDLDRKQTELWATNRVGF